MEKNTFGRLGWQVTEMGYGAWSLGGSYGEVTESDKFAALETYLGSGGNFIDTARGYGESENVIGRFLKAHDTRNDVVLCSKIWPTDTDKVREHMEESLRELQVDLIDLMYVHNPPDDPGEMNRVLDVFSEFKEQGKIKAIGASVKGRNVTGDTQALCRQYIDTGRVDALQIIFTILRQSNRAVFDYARERGVALVGRTCLESGFLTNKYEPGHTFTDHRKVWNGAQADEIIRLVADLADELVHPPYEAMAQVALRFCLDQDGLATIIPGAKNGRQAGGNARVTELPPLPDEVHAALRERFAHGEQIVNVT
jgi:aryl-alcohol dehydrogenase-like predicted oxidoreductase